VSLAQSEERTHAYLFTHAVAATVLAHRGELDQAATHTHRADHWLTLFSGPTNAADAALARATVARTQGDDAGVIAAVASLPDQARTPEHDSLLAEAQIILGQLDQAAVAVTRLETATPPRASTRLDAARLRGELAAAADHLDEAAATFAAGDTLHGTTPRPFAAARLALAHGRFLRRRGEARQAVERLRAARTAFVALGARIHLEEVDQELDALNVRPPARGRRDDPLQLTPRQADVARLVARGLSNKEVAAELYVSPHAVSYHLRHVYAKLDLTSRRELRQRLSAARA
jgi:DNA-binding CsgD family transcriptional regulator